MRDTDSLRQAGARFFEAGRHGLAALPLGDGWLVHAHRNGVAWPVGLARDEAGISLIAALQMARSTHDGRSDLHDEPPEGRPDLDDIMRLAGYRLSKRGGEPAWERDLGDGTRLWIAFDDFGEQRTHAPARGGAWMTSRRSEAGAFVSVCAGMQLDAALATAERLPHPVDVMGEPIDHVYLSLAAALDDVEAQNAEGLYLAAARGLDRCLRVNAIGDGQSSVEVFLLGPYRPGGRHTVCVHVGDDPVASPPETATFPDRPSAEAAFARAVAAHTPAPAPGP